MSNDPFLIVGTGRCGTTYCTEVLKAAGLNVTHQTHFTFQSLQEWFRRNWTDPPWRNIVGEPHIDGEASFMAVPYLLWITTNEPDMKIIHVYRDKDEVIDSWLRSGQFGDEMGYIYPELTNILEVAGVSMDFKNPRQRANAFHDAWIRWCTTYSHTELHIDDANPAQLIQAVGRSDLYMDSDGNLTEAAHRMWAVPTDTNKHEGGA